MHSSIVTLVGGTGFLGRYVVQTLAREGYTVQVIARGASRATHLKTLGFPGQIVLRNGDVTRPKSLHGVFEGSYAVVNLVGLLFESGKRQKFSAVHAQCPERLAKMAKNAGVPVFVQMSALSVDKATHSDYARTKLAGEKAVQSGFPQAAILRPSMIFGADDNFLNQFARMARFSPALPLIRGGKTRFQPVFAGDVAKAVSYAVGHADAAGKIYELGGPQNYSFRQILQFVMDTTRQKRLLLPLPGPVARIMGFFAEMLPRPFLTRDQLRLLKSDNVLSGLLPGFAEMDIQPESMELRAATYLLPSHSTPDTIVAEASAPLGLSDTVLADSR